MQFENAVLPTREQAAATLKGAEGGPVTMLNLLKFRAHADYPDGDELSGEIA
jgi:hypothetical protein